MLQRQTFQELSPDQNQDQAISLPYLFDILKRRALYFAIPFLLVLAIGTVVTIAWPAKYLAEGKILISSQEIPTELVRPTVSTVANERIQYIQQRIMTRDNLLAIAKKFNVSMGWQGFISGTEIVDFIRDRIKIKPLELTLQGERRHAIAFTIGFEYEQPQIATRVANELVTMVLNEDVRTRTAFAAETTKFLDQEVKRLENQLSSLNKEIAERVRLGAVGPTYDLSKDDAIKLAALKAELVVKSAIYSDTHPDIRALKRQIEALEKAPDSKKISSESPNKLPAAADADVIAGNSKPVGLDTLLTQRLSTREELTAATQKLAAARLGESLERGQHSERLEVIEQPSVPTKPISPNRPKIFVLVCAFAMMAGGGVLAGAEMLNPAIRRSSDIHSLIDSHLIVSIPHISTRNELHRKKRKLVYWLGTLAVVVLVGLTAIFFVLPPPDILFDKIMTVLLR